MWGCRRLDLGYMHIERKQASVAPKELYTKPFRLGKKNPAYTHTFCCGCCCCCWCCCHRYHHHRRCQCCCFFSIGKYLWYSAFVYYFFQSWHCLPFSAIAKISARLKWFECFYRRRHHMTHAKKKRKNSKRKGKNLSVSCPNSHESVCTTHLMLDIKAFVVCVCACVCASFFCGCCCYFSWCCSLSICMWEQLQQHQHETSEYWVCESLLYAESLEICQIQRIVYSHLNRNTYTLHMYTHKSIYDAVLMNNVFRLSAILL